MEAVAQICDAHLTDGFELGENFTTSEIIDVIKEVFEELCLCQYAFI